MNRIVLLTALLLTSFISRAQKDCRSTEFNLPSGRSTSSSISLSSASTFTMESNSSSASVSESGGSVITIPVVVHVLYNNASQNISDAQIASQLIVLNNDYNGRNADRSKVPAYFASLIGSGAFEFKLANSDAKGIATSGIVRKYTTIKMFSTDDRIKFSSIGGDDAWDRNKYLNIWVGNLAGGIVGYSSNPGSLPEKDGVVIAYTAFGTMGTASAPYNMGRTATHEIGHWMNLLHIWGDAFCGDDQVNDTPKQRLANKGFPTGEKFSCEQNAHGDMYMNFMDLTDDACMKMFTLGQVARMRALFERGGARYSLLFSKGLSGKTINQIPVPADLALPVSGAEPVTAKVSVYPNPSSSVINIETPVMQESGKRMITIYNGVGQPVMNLELTSAKVQVNISHLTSGIYFIKIITGSITSMVKFSKN
ncbi:MAG: M43 family zinc metalloprotease [Chitinophagaceae bacterium]